MVSEVAFRSSLICLALTLVIVGFYTHSFKKIFTTYILGMAAIGGVILPDWDFFDRSLSQWCTPLTVDHQPPPGSAPNQITPKRLKIYPVRLAIYTAVYGCGIYKWWMFVSSSS